MKSKLSAILLALLGSAAISFPATAAPEASDVAALRARINQLKAQTQELMKRVQLEGEVLALQEDDKLLTDLIEERTEVQQVRRTERLRADAIGTKLATLRTLDGKVYQQVTIREVNDDGISLQHSAGTTRVPKELLTPESRERFGLTGKRIGSPSAVTQTATPPPPAETDTKVAGIAPPSSDGEIVPPVTPVKPIRPSEGKPAEKALPPKREQGDVTTRVIGFSRGRVRLEISALTNCDSEIKITGVLPYVRRVTRVDVTANQKFTQEFSCASTYNVELTSKAGLLLDQESNLRKSGLESSRLR